MQIIIFSCIFVVFLRLTCDVLRVELATERLLAISDAFYIKWQRQRPESMRERKSTSASALRTRVCACDDSVCVREREGENKRALCCVSAGRYFIWECAPCCDSYTVTHTHMFVCVCLCSPLTGMYLYLSAFLPKAELLRLLLPLFLFLLLSLFVLTRFASIIYTLHLCFLLFINIHMDKKKAADSARKIC